MELIYELEPDTRRKSHIHSPIAFSFANCQGGLCKCKDFVPKDLICPPIAHHVSICKLRKLLEEPLSHKSYDLHSFYLNNFMSACAQGFYINDMPYLTRVLEILAERIESSGIYRRYLKKFLKTASFVPLIYSDSDKVNGILHFGKYLSILGLLAIWLTEKKLRILVYNALIELLTNTKKMFANSVEINFRFVAVENSHLPEIITQLMDIVAEDEYCLILKIALALSQISNVTCKKMMVTNAANFLLMRLLPCAEDTSSINAGYVTNLPGSKEFLETCNITCHILINLVSSLKKETDENILKAVTPKDNLLWAIRYLLRGLVFNGLRTRNVRNMFMEFILLCLDVFPFIEIVSTYLASDLAELSVATEYKNCEDWLCKVQFENNPEDICFKKMLLMSLCFVDKYPALHTIFESKNVLKGLLKLISPDYKTMWHPRDQDSLRSFALISINSVAPYMIRNFFENNGIQCLLRVIEPYTKPSNNNANNGEDLLDILRVFKHISEKSCGMIIHTYIMSSIISIITKLCANIIDGDIITYHDQNILTNCFCILCYYINMPNTINVDDESDSSESCSCPTKDCGCCPILLSVNYLKRILNPRKHDSCMNPRTILAAINYLWTMLLINNNVVQEFIKMEGVYILLDIIDICPLPIQVIGLGCLVDIISENQYAIPFILTWRGVRNKKQIFIALLARVFRDECKKIGTRLNANDIIIDIFNPLMGKVQYQEIVMNEKKFIPNTSLADLLGSARPKIYALLQILNTRYETNVNLINDHYKIGIAPVPRNDLIMLHLANNYFALKISESWHELSQALIASNIDPIDIDAQMIYNLTEKMQKWNEGVQKNQEIILNLEIKKDINLELRLYEIFRQCRLQSAIDALRELKFFARTTDRMFREAHKNRQRLTIDSEKPASSYTVYYETFIKDLNATALFNMEFVLPINNIRK